MPEQFDKHDKEILNVIQSEGRISNQKLADRVSLSTAPCWRRLNRLENEGVIDRYVALLDAEKAGLSVMVYIQIQLNDHNPSTADAFHRFVASSANILECCSISGENDYLLRAVAKDVKEIEVFLMEKLLRLKSVRSANTSFVLKQQKFTTALPIS